MCDSANEVRLCTCGNTCSLYPYRFGKKPDIKPKLSVLKAIKAKCYDCSDNNMAEQRRCEFIECVLWPYRLGHNPNRKGMGNKGAKVRENVNNSQKMQTHELVLV